MHKTARITNAINQFQQVKGEHFWKYLERFKDLLAQCPHHAIKKWRLCQIVYERLDYTFLVSRVIVFSSKRLQWDLNNLSVSPCLTSSNLLPRDIDLWQFTLFGVREPQSTLVGNPYYKASTTTLPLPHSWSTIANSSDLCMSYLSYYFVLHARCFVGFLSL